MTDRIAELKGREIINGRGLPTVAATVITEKGVRASAYPPRGTSIGKYEAKSIYDGGKRYLGHGVKTAVRNINKIIAPALVGMAITAQDKIDKKMIAIDGTTDKSNLGANAILAVSLAVAKAGAGSVKLPLYRYLGGIGAVKIPVPVATVIEGGEHAQSDLDFEDYLLLPVKFNSFQNALQALVETYHILGEIVGKKGFVSDHGAYNLTGFDNNQVFDLLLEAVARAGYQDRFFLGLDMVGEALYDRKEDCYHIGAKKMTAREVISYLKRLKSEYPLIFIEDPFHEDDFEGFSWITGELPETYIVGDDLFASNITRIQQGIKNGAANTLLLKINQAGTITEAREAGKFSQKNNMEITVSVRSKDNNDSFIADFSVALGASLAKFGPPVRMERVVKYNRLAEIEETTDSSFIGSKILRLQNNTGEMRL